MIQLTNIQKGLLQKLGIDQLNKMQEEAYTEIVDQDEVLLLSPTGTGKTLAFLFPLLSIIKDDTIGIQVLVIVPSRELAIQIEDVIRSLGSGLKVNAFYGGRAFTKDISDLNHLPSILVGTPGRIADHIRRETFSASTIQTLVLDEFDKSVEIGFESDLKEIISSLDGLKKKVLTSATKAERLPTFTGLRKPVILNNLKGDKSSLLELKLIVSKEMDKRKTLVLLLKSLGDQRGIVFCNFKDTINEVGEYLDKSGINHEYFYGGMEQQDRERSLIKFRNGSTQLIVATDLAARGLDIPELSFIIHYQIPPREQEFTHRNGRTARMNVEGKAFILQWKNKPLPEFVGKLEQEEIIERNETIQPKWKTVFVSGGRKDKISKGDIAGHFFKQGKLNKDELGVIELKQDCAFVGVEISHADRIVQELNNSKIKKRKVRLKLI